MSGHVASKVCTRCRRDVPLTGFGPQKATPDGLRYQCAACQSEYMAEWRAANRERLRACERARRANLSPEERARKNALDAARYRLDRTAHRRSYLRRYYGITVEQYDAIAAQQQGKCAICGGDNGPRLLAVDHDHRCCPGVRSCGICVRGLLCGNCNNGLGRFKDDEGLLAKAVRYLATHPANDERLL